MRSLRKKVPALFLAICLVLSMSAATVRAEEPAGGEDAQEEGYTVVVTADDNQPAAGSTVHLTAEVKGNGDTVADLEEAGLKLWWWTDVWGDHTDGNSDAEYSNYGEDVNPEAGSGLSLSADVRVPSAGTYYIAVTLEDAAGTKLYEGTAVTLDVTEGQPSGDDDTEPVTGAIDVDKVDNLSDDFIMGLDISSVISEFNSGVTYKDFDGNTIDNITDFCKFLKEDCGITHVRVRVWNDPRDSEGNGYGGGDNDVNTAVEIARGCSAAGLKMLVDFHYSDFWADPGKQQAPKAWQGYSLEQKADAVKAFTADALGKIGATGADIDMVQVGNETTNDFVESGSTENMCTLFNAGAEAVRAYDPSIRVVIHFTNPERENQLTNWAKRLSDNQVDYDILATSYYPYWHGTLENLKSQFQAVRETYGKDVMVAETSYAYTLADTDGHSNTVREGQNDTNMAYPFSVQGQADCIRNIINAVNEAGGLGVYYWEPAWITVGDTTGLTGAEYDAQVAKNSQLWEANGSGWASSYAAEYDPDDAGLWYGGSAVDNQAMFYADGTPTESLHVWDYVRTGAVSDRTSVNSIAAPEETVEKGETYSLPETVQVVYNDGAVDEPVVWNQEDLAEINTEIPGKYEVTGTVTFSKEVTAGNYAGLTETEVVYTLTVQGKEEENLITDEAVSEFESLDAFEVSGPLDLTTSAGDVYSGTTSLHWYSVDAADGEAVYTLPEPLNEGWYTLETVSMGYAGDTVALSILDGQGNVLASGEPSVLGGWIQGGEGAQWPVQSLTFHVDDTTEVRLALHIGINAGGWGSLDHMVLRAHENLTYTDQGDGTHDTLCADCGTVLQQDTPCVRTAAEAADMTGDKAASVTYRCVCGSEETVEVVPHINGLAEKLSLTEGDTTALEAGYESGSLPDGVTLQGVYASSDEKVVQVDADGNVTAAGAGTAEITYIVKGAVTIDGTQKIFIAAQDSVTAEVKQKADDQKEPTTPEEPTDPKDPITPEEPTDPKDPITPEEPTDPKDPITPQEPTDPKDPITSQEPTDPKNPATSEEPTGSENTTTSGQPAGAAGSAAAGNAGKNAKTPETGDDGISLFIPVVSMGICIAVIIPAAVCCLGRKRER